MQTYCEIRSFNELYYSPIVHIKHMKPIVQDLTFYCTKKIPNKNHFCHAGETHFGVLAKTLIFPCIALSTDPLQLFSLVHVSSQN